MCELVVAKRVHRSCPIIFSNRSTHVVLVELNMVNFYVIFGMDWLHVCFATIDCRTSVVKFNFPKEPNLELKGGNFLRSFLIVFLVFYHIQVYPLDVTGIVVLFED